MLLKLKYLTAKAAVLFSVALIVASCDKNDGPNLDLNDEQASIALACTANTDSIKGQWGNPITGIWPAVYANLSSYPLSQGSSPLGNQAKFDQYVNSFISANTGYELGYKTGYSGALCSLTITDWNNAAKDMTTIGRDRDASNNLIPGWYEYDDNNHTFIVDSDFIVLIKSNSTSDLWAVRLLDFEEVHSRPNPSGPGVQVKANPVIEYAKVL